MMPIVSVFIITAGPLGVSARSCLDQNAGMQAGMDPRRATHVCGESLYGSSFLICWSRTTQALQPGLLGAAGTSRLRWSGVPLQGSSRIASMEGTSGTACMQHHAAYALLSLLMLQRDSGMHYQRVIGSQVPRRLLPRLHL